MSVLGCTYLTTVIFALYFKWHYALEAGLEVVTKAAVPFS